MAGFARKEKRLITVCRKTIKLIGGTLSETKLHTNISAADLGDLLGFSAATKFMALHEGNLVDIPICATDSHPLDKLLGTPAFRRLCSEFGGKTLFVPYNAEMDRFRMIGAIAAMVRNGRNIDELATMVEMKPRQIAGYLAYARIFGLLKDRDS